MMWCGDPLEQVCKEGLFRVRLGPGERCSLSDLTSKDLGCWSAPVLTALEHSILSGLIFQMENRAPCLGPLFPAIKPLSHLFPVMQGSWCAPPAREEGPKQWQALEHREGGKDQRSGCLGAERSSLSVPPMRGSGGTAPWEGTSI